MERGHFPKLFVVAVAAVVAWLTFYAGWLALTPWGERGTMIFTNSAYHVPIVAATVLSAWAAVRGGGGPRIFWVLLAASNAVWLAAEVLWSVRDLTTGEVPFPWWTDAGYLLSYAILLVAVLRVFRPSVRAVPVAAVLEGAIVMLALGLLWWWVILRELALSVDLTSLVGLAYPSFGLVLLGILASTRLLPSRRGTLALRLVALGIASAAAADGLYTHAAVNHSYLSGDWVELGWQAQAGLFSLAAVAAVTRIDRRSDWLRFRRPSARAAGTILAPAAVLLVVVAGLQLRRLDWMLLAVASPLAVTLAARVVLAVRSGSLRSAGARGVEDAAYFADQLRRQLLRALHYGEGFGIALFEASGATAAGVRRLAENAGELDVTARLPDGRVAVLMPRLEAEQAFGAAESLRATFGATASAGVVVWEAGESGERLVERAEALLATARRLGGNHTRGPEADRLLMAESQLDPTWRRQLLELVAIVDARYGVDPFHSRRVSALAEKLAIELDLDHEAIRRASLGGLLHAIGTLTIADADLHASGSLALLEERRADRHAQRGGEIVRRIRGLRDVALVVEASQDGLDATGPRGRHDEGIPVEARIVAVANALVTLTTERPGVQELSLTSALTELWRFTDTRYDATVVSALFRLVREDERSVLGEVAAALTLA